MNVKLIAPHGEIVAGTVLTDVVGDGVNFIGVSDGKELVVPRYKCEQVLGSTQRKTLMLEASSSDVPVDALISAMALKPAHSQISQSPPPILNQIPPSIVLDERARASYLT